MIFEFEFLVFRIFFKQVLRSSGPRLDKKPNFLKNKSQMWFIGWTKLGWYMLLLPTIGLKI